MKVILRWQILALLSAVPMGFIFLNQGPIPQPSGESTPNFLPHAEAQIELMSDEQAQTYIWHDGVQPSASRKFLAGKFRGDCEHAANCLQLIPTQEPGACSNWIKSYLDPMTPKPVQENSRFNFRAELRREPWRVDTFSDGSPYQTGFEHWLGWTYKFPETYKWDTISEHVIFQYHSGTRAPNISLKIRDKGIVRDRGDSIGIPYHGHMMFQQHYGTDTTSVPNKDRIQIRLPIVNAGDELHFVLHVVGHDSSSGEPLTQLWINDSLWVSTSEVPNVYDNVNHFPTPKWGYYSFAWRQHSKVILSLSQGINKRELLIGPIRELLRKPDSPYYLQDAYEVVNPQTACKVVSTLKTLNQTKRQVSIHWNSQRQTATLRFEGNWAGKSKISLWDVNGRSVQTRTFLHESALTYPLATEGLSPGIYFVQIENSAHRARVKLLIR